MRITANCKINLTMEVLGKRDDGYHNVRTLMQFLDLGDTLDIEPADSFSFWCDDEALRGENNLAVRAYRLMERSYTVQPLSIKLYKKTPCMSGMGGGSADAAAVLHAVNSNSGLGLTTEQLCDIGKTIGADVPACVVGGLLFAEGIGEQITPLEQSAPMWFCVIKPPCAFSTPAMYARLDAEQGTPPPVDCHELVVAAQAGDAVQVAQRLTNSFEQVAEPRIAIDTAKEMLCSVGAVGASMTGAGSAVFGIFANKATAGMAYNTISKTGIEVYLCRSAGRYKYVWTK